MKLNLDIAVNILLGVTCVVVTSVGVVDLRAKLSTAPPPSGTVQPAQVTGNQPTRPAPVEDVKDLTIPTDEGIIKTHGNPKVALVEFSDFECPYCGAYVRGAYRQIQEDFVESGKVEYVFVDYPREAIHPHAMPAAEAFRCAAAQGHPWEMHDQLFGNQSALTESDFLHGAEALGLALEPFKRCVAAGSTPKLQSELALGERAGIRGTPSFLIGHVQSDGQIRVARRLTGTAPYAVFKSELDTALAPASAKSN